MNGSQDFPDTVSPLKNEKQISEVKSAGEMANDGFEKAEIASSSELSDPEETDELEKEQTVASDAQDLHEVDVSEPMKQCSNCGARSTSVWRKGGPAADSLMCNACGLYWYQKKRLRPSSTISRKKRKSDDLPLAKSSSLSTNKETAITKRSLVGSHRNTAKPKTSSPNHPELEFDMSTFSKPSSRPMRAVRHSRNLSNATEISKELHQEVADLIPAEEKEPEVKPITPKIKIRLKPPVRLRSVSPPSSSEHSPPQASTSGKVHIRKRPRPRSDLDRAREQLILQTEDRITNELDEYYAKLRELYHMKTPGVLPEQFDPANAKVSDQTIGLKDYLEENDVSSIVEKEWYARGPVLMQDVYNMRQIVRHCLNRVQEKTEVPLLPPRVGERSSRKSGVVGEKIPCKPSVVSLKLRQTNPLDRLLSSFVYLDEEEITYEQAQLRAEKEALIRNRVSMVRKEGKLGGISQLKRRYPQPTFGVYGLSASANAATITTDLNHTFHQKFVNSTVQHAKLVIDHYRYKRSMLRRICKGVEKYWESQQHKSEKSKKAEEQRLRRVAKMIGKDVKARWKLAESIVRQKYKSIIKQQAAVEGKKELDKILERSTKMLEIQQADIAGRPMVAHDGPMATGSQCSVNVSIDGGGTENETSDAASEISGTESEKAKDFDSDGSHETDTSSDDEELQGLEDDANMPVEDLLRKYGYANNEPDLEEVSIEPSSDIDFSNGNQLDDARSIMEKENETLNELDDISMDFKMEKDVNHGNELNQQKSESRGQIPVPFLIRANLRDYQRDGLTWLASLYHNNLNGMLCDEMGLGKTLQSISLLAHLACDYHDWGPHLIVVPTSVIVNWEMEFRRWCPGFKILSYYGHAKERKEKRQGWTKENNFHVCITSYHLAITDAKLLKRIRWTYLILDEAHHVKNFRSQRWQTLLSFNSERRLLLTGTPLQNNLMELWSLMYFLMPSGIASATLPNGFTSMSEFQEWFSNPVDKVVESVGIHTSQRLEDMDPHTRMTLFRLHTILRPYILRRLKSEVEKQLPKKFEHVIFCKLSPRQRFLYDEFMSRAQTKDTLKSANFLNIISALMQLRKVCNHPDLFAERPVSSPFIMKSEQLYGTGTVSLMDDGGFRRKEKLVRRLLSDNCLSSTTEDEKVRFLEGFGLVLSQSAGKWSKQELISRFYDLDPSLEFLKGRKRLDEEIKETEEKIKSMSEDDRMSLLRTICECKLARLKAERRDLSLAQASNQRLGGNTAIGINPWLLDRNILRLARSCFAESHHNLAFSKVMKKRVLDHFDWSRIVHDEMNLGVRSLLMRILGSELVLNSILAIHDKALCTVPLDSKPTLLDLVTRQQKKDEADLEADDLLFAINTRRKAQFPDKWLLQYDCGKLQTLATLLRYLDTNDHRCLIFTQMTKVLDILESFLNIHGYRYVRLDGSTKPEMRQRLMDRYNADKRILCFILSTRSGGVGLNLTGADTDWNPAMDAQAQDRCHRIGQTRDVHIYRLISEHTVEENILRRSRQKRYLDEIVIQDANFTTDWFEKDKVQSTAKAIAASAEDDTVQEDNTLARVDDWKQLFRSDNYQSDLVNTTFSADARVTGFTPTAEESAPANLEAVITEAELAEDERDVSAMWQARQEIEIEQGVDLKDFDEFDIAPDTEAVGDREEEDLAPAEGSDLEIEIPSDREPVHLSTEAVEEEEGEEYGVGHVDDYMLRFLERELLGDYFELVQPSNV